MLPIKPLPPDDVRILLEKRGYRLLQEDEYNWWFVLGEDDAPIVVPHGVDVIPLELVRSVVSAVGTTEYFEAVRVAPPWGPPH